MVIIKQRQKSIEDFWVNYWRRVGKDTDRISDASIYPLFPVDRYVKPGQSLLEVGCGMGRVFKHYYLQGRSMIGLEYDPGCLRQLRAENPAFPLLQADARALPIQDASLDMVMAFGVVSSIEKGNLDVLSEIGRVLRPGGLICASVACDTPLRRLQNLVGNLGDLAGRLRGNLEPRVFHAWAYRPHEWSRCLEQAGFEVLDVQPSHSRVLFWQYLPFLRREGGELDLTQARDGEKGYRLNSVGESLFQVCRRRLPWLIAVGVVAMGRKPE
ncbi:MAG: hypothetical protein C0405_14295 [Desulfovibrio sp.]|nr:hypothetical protein [Desulfovibrio sp.]